MRIFVDDLFGMSDSSLSRELQATAKRNHERHHNNLFRKMVVYSLLAAVAVLFADLSGLGRYGAYAAIALSVLASNLLVRKLEETHVRRELESLLSEMGRCERCGYDRRGLTTTRCPECGTEYRSEKKVGG